MTLFYRGIYFGYMNKTVINVKTDKNLKTEAQKTAKALGLPLGTIINAYLRELVQEKRVVFSIHPEPNIRTQKILNRALNDIRRGKNISGPFKSAEEMISSLNK